ncbi:hypothetical protein [Halopolyspora algeriensis]|uniref:hypothetical protein n=1 Tax=Halopolyspora algeriensis TaxID=1500506 RepID=UPI00114FCACB|nr:hypothetical protein [Halopolyspora algeriensis]
MQTTGDTNDAEHRRWRNLCAIAAELAGQHGRTARVVRHANRWLDHAGDRLRDDEIVVTWTVADAELIRHQLHEHLPPSRVLPAAPRVRAGKTARARGVDEIPPPRGRGGNSE